MARSQKTIKASLRGHPMKPGNRNLLVALLILIALAVARAGMATELYEAFPDRFMLGMDVTHAPGMNPKNYGQRAQRFRELLPQLTAQAAAAFAEGNVTRIFKLHG